MAGAPSPPPAEAAKGADIVFYCVGNDDDLRRIILGEQEAFAGMSRGALLVDRMTASANVCRELTASEGEGLTLPRCPGRRRAGRGGELQTHRHGPAVSSLSPKATPMIDRHAGVCIVPAPVDSGQSTKMVNEICAAG